MKFFRKRYLLILLFIVIIAIFMYISKNNSFSMDDLTNFFKRYAYQPYKVYIFVVLFMTASSFGMPIPEELTLVSVGFIAYMASNPDKFPPPETSYDVLNTYTLAVVAFFAVLLSDILVYTIGRFVGKGKYIQAKLQKGKGSINKVNEWFNKYGKFAIFFFRFAPGIRFFGHITCGITKVRISTFLLVDGFATLISVPTQVFVVAYYGKTILENIKQFKIIFFSILLFIVIIILLKKYFNKEKTI